MRNLSFCMSRLFFWRWISGMKWHRDFSCLNSVGATLWQWMSLLTPFPWIQMLLCRLCPWHMCHWSMYSTFNGFDLQSSWMSIIVPSGGTQYKAYQQGRIQGLSLIRITPLIWIKILEASWLTAFNHFDVPLKRASLLVHATWAPDCFVRPGRACFSPPLSLSGSDRCGSRRSNIHARRDSPTVEGELSLHRVHAPGVLGHALVRAGVLLLEVRDFQDAAGFPHVHFPGEGDAVHSPPVYRRHRAARRGHGEVWPSEVTAFIICANSDLLKAYLRL